MRLKRRIAILCLFIFFVNLIYSGTVEVKADANDRLGTYISLAQGKLATEIEEIENMENSELQCIALYLTNFYKTWNTRLNIEASLSTDSVSSNKEYDSVVDMMTSALSDYCGFDKDMAKFLVAKCLSYNVQTRQLMYVKETDFRRVCIYYNAWSNAHTTDGNILSNVNPDTEWKDVFSNSNDKHNSIGTLGSAYVENKGANSGSDQSGRSWLWINNYEAYIKKLSDDKELVKDKNGVEYVPVTYPMFLSMMNLSYLISCYDILGDEKREGYEDLSEPTIKDLSEPTIKDLFDGIGDRYLRRADLHSIKTNFDDDTNTSTNEDDDVFINSITQVIKFYWLNTDGTANPIFSTSNECMKMYSLLNDDLDYANGVGSAFLGAPYSEVKSMLEEGNFSEITAFEQKLYVNWVGDILVDTKFNLIPILPGCANPYMITAIEDRILYGLTTSKIETLNDKMISTEESLLCGNRLALVNVFALQESNKLVAMDTDFTNFYTPDGQQWGELGPKDSRINNLTAKGLAKENTYIVYHVNKDDGVYDAEASLFELDYWRYYYGSKDYNWDTALGDSFGIYDPLYTYFEKDGNAGGCGYTGVDSSAGEDYIGFPSWSCILQNPTMQTFNGAVKDRLDRFGTSSLFSTNHSNGTGWNSDMVWWFGYEESDNNSEQKLSAFIHGESLANATMVAYDNLKGFSNDMKPRDFFHTADITETYKNLNLQGGTYQSISDTKIGYSLKTKQFFQRIFLTYCLAYFNTVGGEGEYNPDNHVVNLKLQTKLFPTLSEVSVLDWEGLELSKDETANEVLSFTYYLLHPDEGSKYVSTWLKNKISGIFIGWHEDIVGSSDSNSSLGMTQYLGFSGYVTTPNLSDIGWINAIVSNYTNIIVYVLILMAIIMLTYIIVGQLTVQRTIIGFILFGFSALLPPVFINTTISIVNTTCDSIFSSKFDYWAIVQTEEYLGRLQSYKDNIQSGSDTDIMVSILGSNVNMGGVDSETGYTGMRVKWISPKKFNDMAELTESMNNNSSWGSANSGVLQSMVINSVASTISGETYLGMDNALYLYRDILDIYRYGAISYNIYGHKNLGGISDNTFLAEDIGNKSNFEVSNASSSIFYNYWKYDSTQMLAGNRTITDFKNVWSSSNSHLSTIYDSSNIKASYNTNFNNITVNTGSADYKGLYFRLASNLYNDDSTKGIKFLSDTSSLNAIRNGFINNKFTKTLAGDIKNYYTTDNLAITLLATYSGAYRTIGMHRLSYLALTSDISDSIALNNNAMPSGSNIKKTDSFNTFVNNYVFAEFPEGFNYTLQSLQGSIDGTYSVNYSQLSHFYYGLYSESPYYFMNYEFRDLLKQQGYVYDPSSLIDRGSGDETDSLNKVVDLFLKDKQSYFYNYTSGDGYGELKDFMNMHDFFYYVLPAMKTGVLLVQDFDADFGFYTYDTCPLRIQPDGSFKYNGLTIINAKGEWVSSQTPGDFWSGLNAQQRYEFWHDLNVNLLSYNYCSYVDLMYECDYVKSEHITVLGKKFYVSDPLDPMTYFEADINGNVTAGRYMVFSRSEMEYYGLSMSDLTQVEKKIIDMQDAVYKEAISLTNYYNLSNETLIHNYCLLQLFEFNKAFSQDTILGESFTLYPQGYELKATSYDGYLRLILSGSTGEDLMTDADVEGNTSIYERIMKKTSIFFGLLLIANDFIAVYAIPALKLFFLIIIFFISILIIVASALKVELNILNVLWKSLISPMIFYAGVSVGLAWIVSLFMSNGSVGVTQDSVIIQLGDPTMTILVMLIINIVALILYWAICKKCFADFKKYATAIYHDIFGAVTGTFGKIVGALTSGRYDKGGSGGFSSPKQRGSANNPKSGKSGTAGALAAGGIAGAVTGNAVADAKEDAKKTKYNALADKTGDKINKFEEKRQNLSDKSDKLNESKASFVDNHFKGVNNEQKVLDGQRANAKERLDSAKSNLASAEKDVNRMDFKRNAAMKNASSVNNDANADIVQKSIASNQYKNADKDLKSAKEKRGKAKLGIKSAEAKLDSVNSRQELLDSKRNALASDKKYNKNLARYDKKVNRLKARQDKYTKKINKSKAKQAGLNAKGINRYKVAATLSMGAKSMAKGAIKGTGKALKNSARLAGKATVATARTIGNIASATTKATVNALSDNVVDSTRK